MWQITIKSKIFEWDNPPPTGHPGEDFGCRCVAEPYYQGITEFAYQEITSEINDNPKKWTDFDLIKHYYLGSGVGLTLAEIAWKNPHQMLNPNAVQRNYKLSYLYLKI